jgi:hypothetical protein
MRAQFRSELLVTYVHSSALRHLVDLSSVPDIPSPLCNKTTLALIWRTPGWSPSSGQFYARIPHLAFSPNANELVSVKAKDRVKDRYILSARFHGFMDISSR